MTAQVTESGVLARRYARALFELADEAKAVDEVAADLSLLAEAIADSADLERLIRSPIISREDQGKVMGLILEGMGAKDLTRRFVGVLARNRRLFALPAVIAAFRALLAQRRGEAVAEVVSAAPLTVTQQQALAAALKRVTGSEVAVTTRVDPGLLGGLVVKLGSRMVDSSLRTKLLRLRFAMKGVA